LLWQGLRSCHRSLNRLMSGDECTEQLALFVITWSMGLLQHKQS